MRGPGIPRHPVSVRGLVLFTQRKNPPSFERGSPLPVAVQCPSEIKPSLALCLLIQPDPGFCRVPPVVLRACVGAFSP